jgi:uncharacterized protein (TIGR02118 family)
MHKFVALYDLPEDSADFEQAYFQTHLPLVEKVPGLDRAEVTRVTRAFRGEPGFSLMAEMYFRDDATLRSALESEEWAAAGRNLKEIGGLGFVTMFTAQPASD